MEKEIEDISKLFQSLRESAASILELKKNNGLELEAPIKKSKLDEGRIKLIKLNTKNRNAYNLAEVIKTNIEEMKDKIQFENLRLQNLIYERNYLFNQIRDCQNYQPEKTITSLIDYDTAIQTFKSENYDHRIMNEYIPSPPPSSTSAPSLSSTIDDDVIDDEENVKTDEENEDEMKNENDGDDGGDNNHRISENAEFGGGDNNDNADRKKDINIDGDNNVFLNLNELNFSSITENDKMKVRLQLELYERIRLRSEVAALKIKLEDMKTKVNGKQSILNEFADAAKNIQSASHPVLKYISPTSDDSLLSPLSS